MTMKTATDPSAGPDDHRRPEDISDSEWVAWQADPLQPAGTTIYQWACFRRALRAMAPENGVEASALVLGAHWRQFKNRRELVVLMRHCADIEKEATWDALVSRPCADKLPYVGANNIPAAMLARLRTLAAVLDHRQGERTLLAPEVEGNLSRLFARQDEYSTSS